MRRNIILGAQTRLRNLGFKVLYISEGFVVRFKCIGNFIRINSNPKFYLLLNILIIMPCVDKYMYIKLNFY